MYISLGQLTSKVPRLCYSNSDFHSSCGVLQLLSYYNASTTSKPITSELNKQIADVFGLADLENFASHILSLYLHCRDREKCDVTLPGSKSFESPQKGVQATTTATATRTAKSNKFILVKQQLCTCIALFCTFFSHRCTTSAAWNFLISRARFTE